MINFFSTCTSIIKSIRGYRKRRPIFVIIAVLLLILLIGIFIPVPQFNTSYSRVLYDRELNLLSATIANDEQWRFPESDSIPAKFEKCILQFEDQYFYYHPGINPISIIRAIYLNFKHKSIISGGSTLSMQVVRLRSGNPERTVIQKLKEIILTFHLELKRSKSEILRLYASHAPFGGNTVGLEAASWRYYERSSFDLTWAESATLAVLPNAPSLVHPGKNPEILKRKRNKLLRQLLQQNIIDTITYETSLLESIPNAPKPLPQAADHFLNYATYRTNNPIIHSTLELQKQILVNKIVDKHYNKLVHNQIHNIGAVIIDMNSGKLLAYTGNTNSGIVNHKYVDVIQAARSTGSILKPLLYCSMLNEGELLPHQLVADIPTRYGNYSPKNFSQTHLGAVSADVALAKSLNVPSVRMLYDFGLEKFYFQLQELGFSTFTKSPDHYGLSLILGGGETSLWELMNIYTTLGRTLNTYNKTGKYIDHLSDTINYIASDNNQASVIEQNDPSIFRASSIYLTLQAMKEVSRPESEAGWEHFVSSQSISWKTGTSFGNKDAWSIGLNAQYCVGIWVGNADGEGRPMLTGNTSAAPIMFEIFSRLNSSGGFEAPLDDLKTVTVCQHSGYIKGPHCPQTETAYVTNVETKKGPCPYHKIIHVSKLTGNQVNRSCENPENIQSISWFVLPPAQEWYYKKQVNSYKTLPEWESNCNQNSDIDQLQIVYPENNMRIYIPREKANETSGLICEAVHRNEPVKLYWYLDEEFLGVTEYIHQMEIKQRKGEHRLIVTDEFGERQEIQFSIIGKSENSVQ